MEPYLLSWIIDGTTWVAASAVVSLFLSLPVSVSALLLFLPVLLSWLYSASSFSPSPHGHRFRRLLIAHRGGRFRPVRKRAGSVSTVSRPLSGVTAASSAAAAVLHPENSLAAFRLASQQPRVGAVELDTWLSADHQPIVLHDGYLHRMTDGVGHVRSFTVQQLQALAYKTLESKLAALSDDDDEDGEQPLSSPHSSSASASASSPAPSAASSLSASPASPPRLPTLEEVVQLILPSHLSLMIEVKEVHSPVRMAAALHSLFVRHSALYERAFVASFLPQALLCVRRADPLICTALLGHPHLSHLLVHQLRLLGFAVPVWLEHSWLCRALIDGVEQLLLLPSVVKWLGCSMVCVHVSAVSAAMLSSYRRAGVEVAVWTVNSRAQRRWLEQQGCSVIADFYE